jgi:hypothetical protein
VADADHDQQCPEPVFGLRLGWLRVRWIGLLGRFFHVSVRRRQLERVVPIRIGVGRQFVDRGRCPL